MTDLILHGSKTGTLTKLKNFFLFVTLQVSFLQLWRDQSHVTHAQDQIQQLLTSFLLKKEKEKYNNINICKLQYSLVYSASSKLKLSVRKCPN